MLVVYDLSTGAMMPMQSTKDSSVETVAAVAQTLATGGCTDVGGAIVKSQYSRSTDGDC